MVVAYHLIWTAYGWWLPNDPRGSMSREVREAHIEGLGELHYGRRKILPAFKDLKRFYEQAGEQLRHSLLTFSEQELDEVGDALWRVINDRRYTCYAAATMPDHVHLVIRKHRDQAEEMIEDRMVHTFFWPANQLDRLARSRAWVDPMGETW